MTPDERIEALLTRAGQTISDLPKRHEQEHRNTAFDAADRFGGSLCMTQNFEDYILHLTDVIDRMETALENVTGERDYLLEQIVKIPHFGRYIGCGACTHNGEPLAHDPCLHCSIGVNEAFEFAGVPEDWRPGDSD